MTNYTAEQSKQRYIAAMGEALGAQYAELWQEVVYLHRKWMEYVALFGSKPTRIELVNEAAPTFFRIVQDVFWDDMLLHIARLTDPPESGKNKTNLTLLNLPHLTVDDSLRAKLQSLLQEAIAKSEFCRDWRNKLVAHRDLAHALNDNVQQLRGGSRLEVNGILDAIAEIMNAVEGHYFDSSTYFRFDAYPGGALQLLYVLDDGTKAEEEQRQRLVTGKIIEWDISPRDL